jgi:putative transcriptional regulator
MGKDDFEQLIASLGEVLALKDDGQRLGGIKIPYAIDVATVRHKTGLSQGAFARHIRGAVGTIRNWEHDPRIVEETLGKS